MANITTYSSLEEYLKKQFRSKSRSKLRRIKNRLETCFSISYKVYHGNISSKEYNFLFNSLQEMIKRRFSQRGDKHLALKNWETFKNNAYFHILEKKASLFVIYDKDIPIDICLNYHHEGTMSNLIRSYNIDYSKFNLGYIDIIKQLEWCFNNNYKEFDLSRGFMRYKREWCNIIYPFSCHVLYPKKNLLKRAQALFISKSITFKEFLKRKKVNVLIYKLKSSLKRKNPEVPEEKTPIEIIAIVTIPPDLNLIKIDNTEVSFSFLKKITYDFQFINSYNSSHITTYKSSTENTFIIKGKNKQIMINITN